MISQRLQEIRKNKGKIQQEIADNINVARSTYACYESGTREPDFQTIVKLADYYDISLDELFGRIHSKRTPQISLTDDELDLIKKYRALDEDGKGAVKNTLKYECQRTQEKLDKSSKKTSA